MARSWKLLILLNIQGSTSRTWFTLEWSCKWNYHQSKQDSELLYAAISALVRPNPKNEHTKPLWDRLLNTVPMSGTLAWLRTYNRSKWFKAIQHRAARWVLGRYDRLDSVTDMISSLKWRSLELRRSHARLCLLYKQCNGLGSYDCDKLQREHKSRMDTRLSSLSHRFEQLRCTCDY